MIKYVTMYAIQANLLNVRYVIDTVIRTIATTFIVILISLERDKNKESDIESELPIIFMLLFIIELTSYYNR